jgi:hypothetical protein
MPRSAGIVPLQVHLVVLAYEELQPGVAELESPVCPAYARAPGQQPLEVHAVQRQARHSVEDRAGALVLRDAIIAGHEQRGVIAPRRKSEEGRAGRGNHLEPRQCRKRRRCPQTKADTMAVNRPTDNDLRRERQDICTFLSGLQGCSW